MNFKTRWINYQEKIFLDYIYPLCQKGKLHIKSSFQENR